MKTILLSITLVLIKGSHSTDINNFFERVNREIVKFNHYGAKIAWESSVNPGSLELPDKGASYQKKRIKWQQNVCDKLVALHNDHLLNDTQRRQTYLLCRGPTFTFEEARETSSLYEELQSTYSDAKICLKTKDLPSKSNLTTIEDTILNYLTAIKQVTPYNSISTAAKIAASYDENKAKDVLCLNGEEDLDKMMKFSRNEEVLKWLWMVWREKVGPPMREPYRKLVEIENQAARRNGYSNIGASWRDEIEIPELRELCRRLYEEVRPLYTMLHGVVRFFLRRHYGDVVPEFGPIPAHLLGNLWSQNWESISDLIAPKPLNLDESITKLNWTIHHMLKRSEDFYQSLGLPPMPETFWRKSVFAREKNDTRCHGTAADMFQDGDVRLLYCSGTSSEDFYVIHHEMGHIQYYLAYSQQPGIFRQANTALHETIGDTIMLGVMTPQHLYRLGLINDSVLYVPENKVEDNTIDVGDDDDDLFNADGETFDGIEKITSDEVLLLKLALNKIPQIPFSLLIDEYRWKYFEGGLVKNNLNEEFWQMAKELQGVSPPGSRGEKYFDLGAKFHVPDNTPFIRYFLTSFLQHQLFEALCKAAVFGRRNVMDDIPSTITLNRCDIYGSKAAGRLLKDLMSRGQSQHWRDILSATTGIDNISASALKRYYRPLDKLLKKIIRVYRIPIGWRSDQ